jgi:hypothetical protein
LRDVDLVVEAIVAVALLVVAASPNKVSSGHALASMSAMSV